MIPAALPNPADIRSRVSRGRRLVISLDETVTVAAGTAAAQALRAALRPDMTVIASGPRTLTVLQLVTDAQAAAVRPALENLVAEFRQVAGVLVDLMKAGTSPASGINQEYPGTVKYRGGTWSLDPHGDHCRFEDPASGEIVEADIDTPDTLDPYFLLLYAETSGRHSAVVDACAEGFHDMCRLLDRAGITDS